MSTIRTLVCDRCGASANYQAAAANEWTHLHSTNMNGASHLPTTSPADLCARCSDSLQAWFANPQQFRQLHDALEATLLLHHGGPWEPADSMKWTELTGREDITTRALCDAIRKALAHPEEAS